MDQFNTFVDHPVNLNTNMQQTEKDQKRKACDVAACDICETPFNYRSQASDPIL